MFGILFDDIYVCDKNDTCIAQICISVEPFLVTI